MSAMSQQNTPFPESDYLALIRKESETRYEWVDGQVYAMSGAKPAHQAITTVITALLFNALQGKPCDNFDSDTPVRVPTGSYFYPDQAVVCGEPEYVEDETIGILIKPTVIVEVLSATTETRDRTIKFDHYRQIATLRDYVLIWQDAPRIEVFSRGDSGTWVLTHAVGLESSIRLSSLDVVLTLKAVYQRVNFETLSGS